ncbi:adenosine deaminase [bacterium]|nr:MAG: adenosine deaminase [bacterium]
MENQKLTIEQIRLLPKTELHVHLDCSLSFDFLSTYIPDLTESAFKERFVGPAKFKTLAQFLTYATPQINYLQTEQQLRHSIKDLLKQLKHDSIFYAEIRFAPHLHQQKGLTPFEVVQILTDEAQKWNKKWDIQTNFLLCTLRHFSKKESFEVLELVEHFMGKGVVGFDIAGDEAGFDLQEHQDAFQQAFKKDIPITAHAGEALGAQSVLETLDVLKAQRIGHGVRSIENPDLIKKLINNRIHLEVCPSTNVQIDVFPTYSSHPINTFFSEGVSVGINTDTRTITGIDLSLEYYKMQQVFGWGIEEFKCVNESTINHIFIDEPQKKALTSKLNQGLITY